MSQKKKFSEIINPINQLNLYGFYEYFNFFLTLYEKNKLPNIVLLSGLNGTGKSTFIFHFINYILSQDEEFKYSTKNFTIDENNSSYKMIIKNIHPNVFLLDQNGSGDIIKIEHIKKLFKFLNATTYKKNLKIIYIDNSENLNLNSTNALLKVLEQPAADTYFIINHNNSTFLKDTIKSRSVKFNIHFTFTEKLKIFEQIQKNYDFSINNIYSTNFLEFLSPGALLKYSVILNNFNLTNFDDSLSSISFLLDKYILHKDFELLNFINFLIENYYYNLSLANSNNVSYYILKKNKILYLINDMKKYNLDKKNLVISINNILYSEKK